jgi:hypothetical protein
MMHATLLTNQRSVCTTFIRSEAKCAHKLVTKCLCLCGAPEGARIFPSWLGIRKKPLLALCFALDRGHIRKVRAPITNSTLGLQSPNKQDLPHFGVLCMKFVGFFSGALTFLHYSSRNLWYACTNAHSATFITRTLPFQV